MARPRQVWSCGQSHPRIINLGFGLPSIALLATKSRSLPPHMKKFLILLGSIFLALIVLGALGIGFIAMRGSVLDKESKAYADAAIPAIFTTWLDRALLDRASPEFNQATNFVQVYNLFRQGESGLGRLQKCEPAQGQSAMLVTPQTGKRITARYTTKAHFEKGDATITLSLIKHGDQGKLSDSMSTRLNLLHLKVLKECKSEELFLTTQGAFQDDASLTNACWCRFISVGSGLV